MNINEGVAETTRAAARGLVDGQTAMAGGGGVPGIVSGIVGRLFFWAGESPRGGDRRGITVAYASSFLVLVLIVVRFFLEHAINIILYLAWNSSYHTLRSSIEVRFVYSGAARTEIMTALLLLVFEAIFLFAAIVFVIWEGGCGPAILLLVRLGSPAPDTTGDAGAELGDNPRSWTLLECVLTMIVADAVIRSFFLVLKTIVAFTVTAGLAVVSIGPVRVLSDLYRFTIGCFLRRGLGSLLYSRVPTSDETDAASSGEGDEEWGGAIRNATGGNSPLRFGIDASESSIRRRLDSVSQGNVPAFPSEVGAAARGVGSAEPMPAASAYVESVPHFLIRKRVDQVLEDFISIYRILIPGPLWLSYFAGGRHATMVCAVLFAAKVADLYEAALCAFASARQLLNEELEFGRRPTEVEVERLIGQTCPICFDNFTSPIFLPCNHVFCEHCIQEWILRDATCPVCRQPAAGAPSNDTQRDTEMGIAPERRDEGTPDVRIIGAATSAVSLTLSDESPAVASYSGGGARPEHDSVPTRRKPRRTVSLADAVLV